MAVHGRDSLVRLLKRFLASTINPAQTPSGSSKDKEAFDNVKQIIALALIADTGSIYNVLKIAADEYRVSLESYIADIDNLLSVEGLLGVGSNTAESIDVAKLRKAGDQLSNLSKGSQKSLGQATSSTLSTFLRDEMVQLSLLGSTKRSLINIREFEKKISNAWSDIVSKKKDLYKVVSNFSKDDLITGALENAVSVMQQDINIAAELLAFGTSEDFADISRAVELLTAGTKEFLDFIFNGEDPLGTTIVDPSTGFTPFKPEVIQGTGDLLPPSYIAKGDSHRPFLDHLIGSTGGYAENLPTIDKKGVVQTRDETFDLSSVVDSTTNSGTIYFIVDGNTTESVSITTAELLDVSNWADPYAVTKNELYSFLINKYSFVWTALSLMISGNGLAFITQSSNKNESTLEVGPDSYLPFLEALGISEGAFSRGASISKKFKDTNITTTSSSWNDSPVSLRTDGNEEYHLITQSDAAIQSVTSVTEDDLFIEISPGVDEATTNAPYAITVKRPGTYVQPAKRTLGTLSQVPVRKPPSATSYLGEELSGGFIVHEGKTGKIQSTVLTIPNYDESLSSLKGSTWNGYGTHGYWKPVIKSRGKFKHARVTGTGTPAPLKAAGGSNNYVRPGLNRFGNSSHGGNFYGNGVLGDKSDITIYNALIDFLVPSPPVDAGDNEAYNIYFRDSSHSSSAPVTGVGFGPQVYDFKLGDYFRIASYDAGADGTGSLGAGSNYTSGSVGSNILNNGHRIQQIRNWYPTHTFSSLKFLPAADLPLGINANAVNLMDTAYDLDPSLGLEIDGINIEIIHAHKFIDTSADFTSDGIAPGDIIILHETDLGPSYISSSRYIPNDSSVSSATGLATEESKQKFDTSWIKAFEVAYVHNKTTLFLNTGWVEGGTLLTYNKNLFISPFTTNSGYLDLPQPAFTLDSQYPYNNVTDGYNCWYQVLRRGSVDYSDDTVFEDDAILDKNFVDEINQIMNENINLNNKKLIFLGGADNKINFSQLVTKKIIFEKPIATTEGYITDVNACEERIKSLRNIIISLPIDHLLKKIDLENKIKQYWSLKPLVEQGSVIGKFESELDKNRLKHSNTYNKLRYKWQKLRRRQLKTFFAIKLNKVLYKDC